MLVAHRGDTELVPRESPLRLEWQAQQKIRKRVAAVSRVEDEIAPAVRGIDRGCVVIAEKPACFERMRSAHPRHAVADLPGVVAKYDRSEGVLVESQITADAQPGKTRERATLLRKAADPGLHRIVGSQPLRRVRFTRPHVIDPQLVQGCRSKRVCLSHGGRLPPHRLQHPAIGRKRPRRIVQHLVERIRARDRVGI